MYRWRFLKSLTSRFDEIHHSLPLCGHSFNPCDRDVGVVKRKIKRENRIYTPQQYATLIESSSESQKFAIKEVTSNMILDFKSWRPEDYKKTVSSKCSYGKTRNEKQQFQISNYSSVTYKSSTPGEVEVSHFIGGLWKLIFALFKTSTLKVTPSGKHILEKFNINHKTIADIKKFYNTSHMNFCLSMKKFVCGPAQMFMIQKSISKIYRLVFYHMIL